MADTSDGCTAPLLGSEEPHEVQQREMGNLASVEEKPSAPESTEADQLESSFAEKGLSVLVGSKRSQQWGLAAKRANSS